MTSSPRQTHDPQPLLSSPANAETLVPARRAEPPQDAPGIPFAGQSGVASAESDGDDQRQLADVRPAGAGSDSQGSGREPASPGSDTGAPASPSAPAPPTADRATHPSANADDGPLESIGKAIVSPVSAAADDEEPA